MKPPRELTAAQRREAYIDEMRARLKRRMQVGPRGVSRSQADTFVEPTLSAADETPTYVMDSHEGDAPAPAVDVTEHVYDPGGGRTVKRDDQDLHDLLGQVLQLLSGVNARQDVLSVDVGKVQRAQVESAARERVRLGITCAVVLAGVAGGFLVGAATCLATLRYLAPQLFVTAPL